jgi:hypothetical protein
VTPVEVSAKKCRFHGKSRPCWKCRLEQRGQPRGRPRKATAGRVVAAKQMRLQGMGWVEIGRRLKVRPATIRSAVRRNRIDPTYAEKDAENRMLIFQRGFARPRTEPKSPVQVTPVLEPSVVRPARWDPLMDCPACRLVHPARTRCVDFNRGSIVVRPSYPILPFAPMSFPLAGGRP